MPSTIISTLQILTHVILKSNPGNGPHAMEEDTKAWI